VNTHSPIPFEHWIIDDFLPSQMAEDAYDNFFDGDGAWTRRHHLYSRHKETRVQGLSWPVEDALQALEGVGMREYLRTLTGVGPLFSDKDRFGGGQHVIRKGGKLGIHADFTHHPTSGMRRALNLLLYLNKPGDAVGGELELWTADVKRCLVRVAPVFNRAVIFKTSATSFHGHPEPLLDGVRRSLAVYYYVQDAPGSVHDWLRTTHYHPRPWEYGLRLRKWLSKVVKG
jgi:Rps23 Pro-64 3,4-dihydroxylase Tpa1-like proline 4-hydroxylase